MGKTRPHYSGGGGPAPFLPAITRNLDPDAGVGVPYRVWTFAKGFQMEGVEIGDAYEKDRIAYVLGETGTGVNGGGSSNAIKGVKAAWLSKATAPLTDHNTTSREVTTLAMEDLQAASDRLTTLQASTTEQAFTRNLDGTDSTLMDGTTGYIRRFDQVVTADTMALYGMANLGRLKVDEPGIYMVEVKGRIKETHAASNQATYGFGFHVLGSVTNNTFTGDTMPKVSNMVETLATHSRAGSTSAGPLRQERLPHR